MKIRVALAAIALLAPPLAVACVDDDFADAQFKCEPGGGDDECPPGQSCAPDGLCRRAVQTPDACKKRTCDEAQPSCGTVDDGCGGLLECGCWPPLTCGGGGVQGKCGCKAEQVIERSAGAFWSDASHVGVVWTDPENARASDGAFATATLASGESSHYLKAADFGFDLPDTALVRGIELVIERSADAADAISDEQVRLALKLALLPKDAKSADAWPVAKTVVTYGAADDLWEVADPLTPADVNQPNFGMALAAVATADAIASVDAIRLRVHFANPDCPGGDGGS